MSFTLTTSGSIIRKAGTNANSTIIASGSALLNWSDQAEGFIITKTQYDWVQNWGSLASGAKLILEDAASDHAAMKVIAYDMSGYTSRLEAQTMLDVLRDNLDRNMKVLEDSEKRDVIK